MDSWANVEHYADNIQFEYHDKEVQKDWDHSGAYANVKYFHLTKGMYDRKEMLGQYGYSPATGPLNNSSSSKNKVYLKSRRVNSRLESLKMFNLIEEPRYRSLEGRIGVGFDLRFNAHFNRLPLQSQGSPRPDQLRP